MGTRIWTSVRCLFDLVGPDGLTCGAWTSFLSRHPGSRSLNRCDMSTHWNVGRRGHGPSSWGVMRTSGYGARGLEGGSRVKRHYHRGSPAGFEAVLRFTPRSL